MLRIARSLLTLLCCTVALPANGAEGPDVPTQAAATQPARLLPLSEAYRLALKGNPTLALVQARLEAAQAEARRAWSQLKPSATVGGTFTHSNPEIVVDPSAFAPPGSPAGDPVVIQQKNQFGVQVQAGLPLFRGPAYQQIGVARKGVAASRLRLVRTRQTFCLRVAEAYYAALGAREVLAALDQKVAVDRRNLEVARLRQQVGRVTRSDVLRAELELVENTQQRLRQFNTLTAARRRVAILVGLNGPVRLERPAEPPVPPLPRRQINREAPQHRADLQALRSDVAAAEQSKTAAWWSFLPLLDLDFLYRWQEAAGFAGQRDSWSLVGTLTFPLYLGGVRYAELQRARARIGEAKAAEAELARDIAERIAQLTAALDSAQAGLVSATKAVSLAEVTVEEMTVRYEVGSATQLDLLDVTQRQLQARIDLSRSRYARDVARLALANELGIFDPGKQR